MKQFIPILVVLLVFASCETEQINETLEMQNVNLKAKKKIDACHYSAEDDKWFIINVNANAWADHQAHGDVRLDDQDGDGYIAENNCNYYGDRDAFDCDDNNLNVNPGETEILGNEIDDDCNPDTQDGLSQIDVLRKIHEVNGGKPDVWDDNLNDTDLNNWESISLDSNGNIVLIGLSFTSITKLPPEIEYLSNLEVLWINRNFLSSLPPEIGKLNNLRRLWLLGNRLTTLPKEIGNLQSLTLLSLDSNNLASLPPEIGNLSSLTFLDIGNNDLVDLPLEIGKLLNLLSLTIAENPITLIPKEICDLETEGTVIIKDTEDVCEQ